MLEFNKWFFVLLVQFLVLLYILNIILFRPILKLFKDREDATDGALEAARQMHVQKDEEMEKLNREFAEARLRSREKFESVKGEGTEKQKAMLEEAGTEASGIIDKARQELRAETDKARKSLRDDADKFSEEIVSKLVKV